MSEMKRNRGNFHRMKLNRKIRYNLTNLHNYNHNKWPYKPCHVGIHWKALAEHYQMSINVPGFQSYFRLFASFCIG